jgi:peptidyl-dipeptidase A
MLVFARWVLVMCHFERGLYRDPDADHDARWWDLVERFQLVHRPDDVPPGGWASKIHLAVAPVYYQNYLYGELMASQLTAALRREVGGLVERPEAGAWLRERVFRPGSSKRWDHLLADATGEELSVRHFVDEFCR